MKKNLMSGMMLAFLPIGIISYPTQLLINDTPQTETYSCNAISSVDFPEEKIVETVNYVQPKPVAVVAPQELETWFEQYANEYGINSNTLKIIANCESHYNPTALSKSGKYGGMFQYSESTWISNRRAMGLDENPELRFNAQEAIKTTAFKISRDGVGAWPVCGKKTQ